MKGSESSSGSSTVEMPPSGAAKANHSSGNGQSSGASPSKPHGPSEAQFLEQQAKDAKAAMGAVWGDLTATLKHTADIGAWAKRYPIITTSAAAVAGFVASYLLVPVTQDEAKEKWEHLKSTVTGSKNGDGDVESVEIDGKRFHLRPVAEEPKPSAATPGLLGGLLTQALNALKPVVMSLMASKFGQRPENGSPDQSPESEAP